MKKILTNKSAFTLVEMLLVLFVIGILMLLIMPNLNANREKINSTGNDALQMTVNQQAALYRLNEGVGKVDIATLKTAGYLSEEQAKKATDAEIVVDKNDTTPAP